MTLQNNMRLALLLTFLMGVDPMPLTAYDGSEGDSSSILMEGQEAEGSLGSLRLDVLTEEFVVLPEPPCKGVGELAEDVMLKNFC